MQNLKDYVSEDGCYTIPVTWEMYGTVTIENCNNLEEALEIAEKYEDDLPLPTDGEYIDASFKLETEDLVLAQDFYRHDAYFENPEKETDLENER